MPIYIPALWIASGICLFAGIQFVLVGGRRAEARVYPVFGSLCLLLACYFVLTATLYQIDTPALAGRLLQAKVMFSCAIYVTAVAFIGLYSGLEYWRLWFVLAALAFSPVFAINLFSPDSALYSSISAAPPLMLPWHEQVSFFDGVASSVQPIYYLAAALCYVWALGCCVVLWRQRLRGLLWPLAVYLAIESVAFVHAQFVERSGARAITFEALAFVALVMIMSDALRRQLRAQTRALAATLDTLQDETWRRQSVEADLRRLAYHDRLSGLPNRHRMQEDLRAALASTDAGVYALALIDVDHFKTINDAIGRSVGDEVLRRIGARLAEAAPAGALLGHFGGDEFAVLLDVSQISAESVPDAAGCIAQRVLAHVAEPMRLGDHELVVRASAGVTVFRATTRVEVSDLLRQASVALHRAKRAGRNRVVVFESAMQTDTERRHSLESDLRLALQRGEFELHYQPQVDMGGRFVGAEALLRWRHPVRGLVAPSHFIPIAEESGLIHAIGREVLRRACDERWSWHAAHAHARLAVNISPWQLFAQDFVATLIDTVRSTDANPAQMTLEITENMYLHDLDDIAAKVAELDALGFHFSLDDFGSGFTSLASLKKLPVRELKIDRAFVEGLVPGSRDGFVESMIAIAHHLDLIVVAEGVETEAQRTALRNMSCDVVQGFLVSRPLPAAQFHAWLAAQTT